MAKARGRRPLPAVAAVGTDIVDVARLRRLIASKRARFLDRVFLPAERAYCDARSKPHEHYAVRFAAKEAVLKVLRTGWAAGLGFRDVEVLRDSDGAPTAELSAKAAACARRRGIGDVLISLSHTDRFAVASAVGVAGTRARQRAKTK